MNPTNDTEPEYEIVYGALYVMQNGSAVQSNKGIAVVGVRDTRTGAVRKIETSVGPKVSNVCTIIGGC